MVEDKVLEQLINEGQEIAKQIFNLEVHTTIDYVTNCGAAGVYNFLTDDASIYKIFCDYLVNTAKNVDKKRFIHHLVCHETGHAFDSRKCEENKFFPYIIKVSTTSLMKIRDFTLKTQPLQGVLSEFVDSIFDYSIDKRIAEVIGILDQTAKIRATKSSDYIKNPGNADENRRRIIELTFALPTTVHDFYFSDIEEDQRETIKNCSIKYLGQQIWDNAIVLFQNQEITKASNLYTVIPKLFDELLNVKAEWRLESKQAITTDTLPTFWKENQYLALYVL